MISKILQILCLQPRIEHFFLTVGQNNFGNKIPFCVSTPETSCLLFDPKTSHLLMDHRKGKTKDMSAKKLVDFNEYILLMACNYFVSFFSRLIKGNRMELNMLCNTLSTTRLKVNSVDKLYQICFPKTNNVLLRPIQS